jgi:UDP-glucose 4-epimerase
MLSLTNKRILVTGGAGFVGSNLVKTLVEKYGARVRVIDDLFTGTLDNLKEIDFEFVHGTIEDERLVEKAVDGMDVVFHLASRNIILSNKNPREDLNVNVRGSFNVFEACKHHRVARVVYTSTSSVYGEPETVPVREGDRKRFLNFYSASKYSAEVYANTFFEVFDLPVATLRYSNVYGPNQSPVNPYCGVIGKFISAALANQPLKIYGNGRQTRDYTYVDDAVNATIAAAIHPEAVGEDYNIGTGCETSVNMLAQSVLKITGSSSTIEHVNNRDIDNISRRSIDINKAIADLQYQPQYSIAEGLKKTVNWFKRSAEATSLGLLMSSAVII